MALDLFALSPYLFGIGVAALLGFGAACLACVASVLGSSYFVWLNTLHLLKQNDKLVRRVISFSESTDAKTMIGYEAQAEASGQQAVLLNRLAAIRTAEGPSPEGYGDMAQ